MCGYKDQKLSQNKSYKNNLIELKKHMMAGLFIDNDLLKSDKSVKPTQHTILNNQNKIKRIKREIYTISHREDGKPKLNSSLNSCLFRGRTTHEIHAK